VLIARFSRDDGCAMYGLTWMMGAEYRVQPGWVLNARFNRDDARFNRDDGRAMHGPTGMMGAHSTVQPG